MKKELTIAEARKFFGSEKVFATKDGFIFNDQGKYCSGLTFVIESSFELDKDGKVVNPINYVGDREVTDSLNLDLDGDAKVLFGDFWKSQKGAPCFRPKDPKQAKHLLVEVRWGGCFNSTRGNWSDAAKEAGALYFRRASSHGGGAGHDYWVLPVGYVRQIEGAYRIDWETARAYCAKHSKLQADQRSEADRLYKEKLAAEEASRTAKAGLVASLTKIQSELARLHQPQKFGRYGVDEISFEETYFALGHRHLLYSEGSLTEAEQYLAHAKEWVAGEESAKQAKADARATFVPKYEELRGQLERVGWELSFGKDGALVKDPAAVCNTHWCRSNGMTTYPFTLDGVERLREDIGKVADRMAEEEARSRNAERIRELLASTELPENLWSLFEGSEDLDSVIRKEAEAILAAAAAEKDEVDMHELCNCGYDRRCNAIHRVLERVGGNVAKIRIGSQSASKELARFIAGQPS